MKYVVLIYNNPESRQMWEKMSESQRAPGLRAYKTLVEELSASGELIATEALADASLGKRIAIRGHKTVATDGPFAEVKEQLAGFFLVECDSLERAVEIGGRIPEAALDLVEVRPTMTYSGLEM